MTTSGSIDFEQNGLEVITEALLLTGTIGHLETPSAAITDMCKRALNLMMKTWLADGLHLWTQKKAVLWLDEDQAEYALGTGSTDHAADEDEIISTTLSADAASGDTLCTPTLTTGMAIGDVIGVVQDDDTIHWTTIAATAPFELTVALTDDAASGNAVYTYTAAVERPLRIVNAYRRDANDYDIPMQRYSRQEYETLSYKSSSGTPICFYYDPQLIQGKFYVWQPPQNDKDYRIYFTYQRTIEDVDALTDTLDFPQEWTEAIAYNLAVRIAPRVGANLRQDVALMADALKIKLEGFDAEFTSTYFQPMVR